LGDGRPFNEVNQVYDLGFKDLPWGDTGYLPAMVQEVGVLADGSPLETETDQGEKRPAIPTKPVRQLDQQGDQAARGEAGDH